MMVACRKGGISIMGVYGGFVDKMPFGAAFNKGLTFRTNARSEVYEHVAGASLERETRSILRCYPHLP